MEFSLTLVEAEGLNQPHPPLLGLTLACSKVQVQQISYILMRGVYVMGSGVLMKNTFTSSAGWRWHGFTGLKNILLKKIHLAQKIWGPKKFFL